MIVKMVSRNVILPAELTGMLRVVDRYLVIIILRCVLIFLICYIFYNEYFSEKGYGGRNVFRLGQGMFVKCLSVA